MKSRIKLKGSMRTYLQWPLHLSILLICMLVAVFFINVQAAVIMSVYVVIYIVIAVLFAIFKKPYIMGDLVKYAQAQSGATGLQIKELSIPYGIVDSELRLMWANDALKDMLVKERLAEKSLKAVLPEFMPELPTIEQDTETFFWHSGRYYHAVLREFSTEDFVEDLMWIPLEERGQFYGRMIAVYFYDETAMARLQREHEDQKLVIGLIYIDNYEEVFESSKQISGPVLYARVEQKLTDYVQTYGGIVRKTEKDKYFFVFPHKYLSKMIDDKVSLVEGIKQLSAGLTTGATISIGISADFDTYVSGYQKALSAIELAMARGGNQAVVKDGSVTSYYGGSAAQNEKNTRVKARIKADALREAIAGKEKVLVMGHANGDPDSFGSAIGVYRIAKLLGKESHIVINKVMGSVKPLKEYIESALGDEYSDDMFISSSKAESIMDRDTILVVVDTNKPSQTESSALVEMAQTKVVIDHHRQANEVIDNAILSYVEPNASSASELVVELLQYISGDAKLLPCEAEMLYAGMMIDTNNFLTMTGVRTFEAAAYLKRCGIEVSRLRKFFRTEPDEYVAKAEAIAKASIFMDSFAFSVFSCDDHDNLQVDAAQVANELLNIMGVKASFVFYDDEGETRVSARSIDEVNVQVIMEKLGGGGHLSVAATKFTDKTVEEGIQMVKDVLTQMKEEGEI